MYITIIDELKKPYRVDLRHFGKNRISFGRNEDCDIVLQSEYASRAHGCFYINGDTCVIEDSNSTNGLVYNNQRIKKQKLKDGDEICIKGKASRKELEVRFLFSDTVPQAESHTVEPSVRVVTTERIVEKKVFPLIGKIGMAASVAAVLLLLIFAVILPNKGKKLKGEYELVYSEEDAVYSRMVFEKGVWTSISKVEEYDDEFKYVGTYDIDDNRICLKTIGGEEILFLFDGKSNQIATEESIYSSANRKAKTEIRVDEQYINELPDKVQKAADKALYEVGYENAVSSSFYGSYYITDDDLKYPDTEFEMEFAHAIDYDKDEVLQELLESKYMTIAILVKENGTETSVLDY